VAVMERHPEIEYEVDPDELAMLLAAPYKKGPREIADPIAVFGTASPRNHIPERSTPSRVSQAGRPMTAIT